MIETCISRYNKFYFTGPKEIPDVKVYKDKRFASMEEMRTEFGTSNRVELVPAGKLPLSFHSLIEQTGLKPLFRAYCDKLALCADIKVFDHNKITELDSFSIATKEESAIISWSLNGARVTPGTIFLKYVGYDFKYIALDNEVTIAYDIEKTHKSTYDILINLAHELRRHEIWDIPGIKKNFNEYFPYDLAELLCLAKQKEVSVNLLSLLEKGQIPNETAISLLGLSDPQQDIIDNNQTFKTDFMTLYDKILYSDTSSYSSYILESIDKKMVYSLDPYHWLDIDIRLTK